MVLLTQYIYIEKGLNIQFYIMNNNHSYFSKYNNKLQEQTELPPYNIPQRNTNVSSFYFLFETECSRFTK